MDIPQEMIYTVCVAKADYFRISQGRCCSKSFRNLSIQWNLALRVFASDL